MKGKFMNNFIFLLEDEAFTKQEDAILLQKLKQYGNSWNDSIKDDFKNKSIIQVKQRFKKLACKSNRLIIYTYSR